MTNIISVWMPILIGQIWLAVAQLIRDKKHYRILLYLGVLWTVIAVIMGIAYRLNIAWLG